MTFDQFFPPPEDPTRCLALWRAFLDRMIIDATTNAHMVDPKDKRIARRWFYDPTHAPGSFSWVCEVLSLPTAQILSIIPRTNFPFRDAYVSDM